MYVHTLLNRSRDSHAICMYRRQKEDGIRESVDLMERTQPRFAESHRMRFVPCACVHSYLADYARLYDIDYDKNAGRDAGREWKGGRTTGERGVRSDAVKLVSAFDRYYFRRDSK